MADDVVTWGNPFTETLPEQQGEREWADYFKNLGAGFLEAGSGLGAATEYATGGDSGAATRRYLAAEADALTRSMTPRAQRDLRATYLPDEGQDSAWESFWSSTALKASRSLPSLAATGMTAIVTKSPVATMLVAGTQTAGEVAKDIFESIDKMPDGELRERSPLYAGYRDMMDEADARRAFASDTAGLMPVVAGAISAFSTRFGIEGALLRKGAEKAASGVVRRTATTTAGEASTEFVEEASNSLLADYARAQSGIGDVSAFRALQAGVEGAVIGGVLGAATGPLIRDGAGAGNVPPKGAGTGATAAPQPVPGTGNTVNPPSGSETQYPKTPGAKGEAAKAKGRQRSGVQTVDGPVDATQAAALGAATAPPTRTLGEKAAGLTQPAAEPAPPVTPEVTAPPPAPPAAQDRTIEEKAASLTQPEQPAPAPVESPTQPETPTQLEAQVKELVDGVRQVMLLPKGAPKVEMPKGFEAVTLQGRWYPADTRGTYFYNPASVSADQIKAAAKANKLNDLLNMGPTTKEESDGTVVQGVNEDGVATVQQATNKENLPEDAAVIASKGLTPEATTAPATIESRDAGEPKAPGTPIAEVPPAPAPRPGRVLEAAGNAEVQKQTNERMNAQIKQNLGKVKVEEAKAKKAQEEAASDGQPKFGAENKKTKDKKRAEADAKNEAIAREVFDAHPPTEVEQGWNSDDKNERTAAREAMVARANRALVMAEQLGFKMPQQIRKQGNPVVWLKELQDFASAVGSRGMGRSAAFERLVTREADFRQGDEKAGLQARENRKVEGDTSSRTFQGDAEAKADTKTEEQPEVAGAAVDDIAAPGEDAVLDAIEEKRRTEREAKETDKRVLTPEEERLLEIQRKAAALAAKGADADAPPVFGAATRKFEEVKGRVKGPRPAGAAVADLKARLAKRGTPEGNKVLPSLDDDSMTVFTVDENGQLQSDLALETTDVRTLFGEYDVPTFQKVFGRNALATLNLGMFKRRLTALAGDVPVHIVDPDSPLLIVQDGKRARGYYDTGRQQIILAAHHVIDPKRGAQLLVHEATHAAFEATIEADPRIKDELESMRASLVQTLTERGVPAGSMPYGTANFQEFIAEAFSNPEFQKLLGSLKIDPATEARLEKAFGSRRGIIKNYWVMFTEMVRFALRLPDNAYTMLDATLRIGRQLDEMVSERGVQASTAQRALPALDTSQVADLGRDYGSAAASWAKRTWTKFRSFHQLEKDFRTSPLGPEVKRIDDAITAAGPRAEEIRKEGRVLAERAIDLTKKEPKQAALFADLIEEVRMLDITLEGNNDFGKNNSRHWQAKERFPELKATFDNMLDEEFQELYRDMAAFYRKSHNMIVEASVRNLVDALSLKKNMTEQEVSNLVQRTMDNKLDDTDKAALGETLYENLKNAREFARVKGDYFPLMRFGDYVVVTEDSLQDLGKFNGTADKDGDTALFRGKNKAEARRNAEAYSKHVKREYGLTQLGEASTVYIDTATGNEVTKDQSKSLNNVEIAYRLKFQTKGVQFFDSAAEAERYYRTNPDNYDKIYKPEERAGEGYHPSEMTGTQMSALEREINGRNDLNDGQKKLLNSIVKQASVRMLAGNRIGKRRLKSQKVQGASTDFARALLNYNHAMANHVTTAESAPIIRDALAKMEEKLRGYEGDDRPELVSLLKEIKLRVEQGIHDINEPSAFMKDLYTISSTARLASPAYSIIQSVQPAMTTLPMLAGRFNPGRAVRALNDAYGQIGLKDQLVSSVFNTKEAVKDFRRAGLLNAADPVADIRKRISGDAELTAMFDELVRLNAISTNAGFEVASAVQEGRGAVGKTIAGLDRIFRQVPQVMEVINRSVTGIAAYKLARESGMDQKKATQYALDLVRETQGDYSASNAPRFFNNPVLRPAMQFRKYAQMMTYLMVDLTRQTMDKNLSVEERKIAAKQLASFMAVQIAVAGALSLPGLEIIKAGFLVASLLGLGGGWDEQEEKLRKLADDTFGKGLGQMITSGVLTRAGGYGIDVSQRMSLSDMWLFGEPRKSDRESTEAYAFRLLVGAPGTFITQAMDGVRDLGKGEFESGLGKLLPVKFAADFARGMKQYNDPRAEAGLGTVATNTIGFKTAAQAERSREIGSRMRRKQDLEEKSRQLAKEFYNARTRGERIKAAARNREFNKTLEKSEWRLRAPTNEDWERPAR